MSTAYDGLSTEISTTLDFAATLALVRGAIDAAGLTIFAEIDHRKNAEKAGLVMPEARVHIYGAAKGGTPVMLAAPRSALDLPLRVLGREIEGGAVVAFHPIVPELLKAGAPEAIARRLEPAQHIFEKALKS